MGANGKQGPDIGSESRICLTTDSFPPGVVLEAISTEGPIDGKKLMEKILRPSRPFAPQAEVDALIKEQGLEDQIRYDATKGQFYKRRGAVLTSEAG
jgi:hypothetical protein